MLNYIDDLILIGFKPREEMDTFNHIYWLKEVFGPPERCLGANVEKVKIEDGRAV